MEEIRYKPAPGFPGHAVTEICYRAMYLSGVTTRTLGRKGKLRVGASRRRVCRVWPVTAGIEYGAVAPQDSPFRCSFFGVYAAGLARCSGAAKWVQVGGLRLERRFGQRAVKA